MDGDFGWAVCDISIGAIVQKRRDHPRSSSMGWFRGVAPHE
jgi:hypothetical protein